MRLPVLMSLSFYQTIVSAFVITSSSNWSSLNATLGGQLQAIRPPALPCHQASYNAAACSDAKSNWGNSTWRSQQIGAMQAVTWEQLNGSWCTIGNLSDNSPISSACKQGDVPSYGVRATTVQNVVDAVKFASSHKLPVVVKGTGHDYLGRSTDPKSLLIWTHNFKNISLGPESICGVDWANTLTVGAGVQWGEAYRALAAAGRVVPGGADPDVGASGGQPQGGGHSPLGNTYGMTPDSIIEFEVVTMDGRTRTLNSCQNSDLFWALRGGGGGTYAIVTSTTYQTYPEAPVAFAAFNTSVTDDGYENVLRQFSLVAPAMAEEGWSGYFFGIGEIFFGIFFVPLIENRTLASVNETVQPLLQAIPQLPGVSAPITRFDELPSFSTLYSIGLISPEATGNTPILASRLIPKALLQKEDTRECVIKTLSHLHADPAGQQTLLGHLVAGSPATSRSSNTSAVLPAWRKSIWHMVTVNTFDEGASAKEIQAAFKFTTERQAEPMRRITPGSGSYMNEADPRSPTWKEDYFGENYGRLLAVRRKYDPLLLLRCNRCVGSDL